MSHPISERPPQNIIEMVDVYKTFDDGQVNALAGVSLEVPHGEFVAITGRSGSGKSTLLHLLAALDRPDRGRITVHGYDLTRLQDLDRYRRTEVGLIFQLHNLLPHLDARRNVEIPMVGTRRSRAEREARSEELLLAVELAGKEHRRPPQLSGGERQRVAIARALANQPAVLLADEPTGSLDSAGVERVLDLLQRLRNDRGVTIVMVTHDHDIAASCDRVLTMRDGKIISDERTGFVAARL